MAFLLTMGFDIGETSEMATLVTMSSQSMDAYSNKFSNSKAILFV